MTKAPREFLIFAKPAGPVCNMHCSYCYYVHKKSLYPQTADFRMPDDVLESYIAQQINCPPGDEVSFFWHGGEPTILGLEYFQKIRRLQEKHKLPHARILNNIQTNGILLNEDWCRFLAAEKFSVGLSLDGPAKFHDAYRRTAGGAATHKQVMEAYRLLRKHKVPCDILCVVSDANVQAPLEVYRFFKDMKAQYISFIPLVEPSTAGGDAVTSRTVPPAAFGKFLCTVFDEWVKRDIGKVIVQIFEEAARPAYGQNHSLCIFRPTCGDVTALEHNGDLYACDHFVDKGHFLGNIRQTPLETMIGGSELSAFGEAKRDALPQICRECDVLEMCNGGCPKDRIIKAPDGVNTLNYLCAGYKAFFSHFRPYAQRLAILRAAGHPPAQLMEILEKERAKDRPRVGRNDPCPCGSGLKYKKCCMNS